MSTAPPARGTPDATPMKPFFVHSTKYDGSLHYRYPAQIVRAEPGLLVLHRSRGAPIENYRGSFTGDLLTLEFYWSDRHYNLIVQWLDGWRPYMHYVNIATPATWHDGALRYVDLDLDVIWKAQTDAIILDDEDEFALHQTRFGYPPDLIAQAWRTRDEVRALLEQRAPPFDGLLYNWRPHGRAP